MLERIMVSLSNAQSQAATLSIVQELAVTHGADVGRPADTICESYFQTEEAMREGNPQLILDRRELVELPPPTLLVQPYPDANIPREIPERLQHRTDLPGEESNSSGFRTSPMGSRGRPVPRQGGHSTS